MFGSIARKLFGSANDRLVRTYRDRVARINALEETYESLSDDELRGKTAEFRARLESGAKLDSLMPDAFAAVREAAKRTLGMRHFDVQLVGGMVLHEGNIAEMKTGEGKTLVATLAAYLNALPGNGVHIVTVNDYLAKRDSEWMGKIYRFLGLTVGVIVHDMDDLERQQAYQCDITYATNNELGFDYLRDNMKYAREMMVQRPFSYAIVDEVDSILIDEARTPLIISGPTEDNSALYTSINALMVHLKPEDYELDEKARSAAFNEEGTEKMERILVEAGLIAEGASLYDIANVSVVHHMNQALRAHVLFKKDVDYIVKDNKVVIIDEFTGRMMEGRRYSEGLHQALEAKENVRIQNENQTLASITFQNYFRLYPKLAGMTGTAMTEATEFADIYGLEVIEIPTNVAVARKDEHDEIYRTAREKYEAVIKLIEECHERRQPVLVGTVSIEKSELLSAMLKKKKIPHNVLNARYHEQEAHIIAQAGKPGAVTIATNMAGRGTDIKLGGNAEMRIEEEIKNVEDNVKRQGIINKIEADIEAAKADVRQAGGLYVVGTERHESRRIDNQLRGRSGRQGDPGASKFFLSLEDDLMRIFGSERIDGMLQKLGLKEGEAIFHPWMNKAIERAQSKVEARNYDIRKNLLKFDDVMNDQRKVIYEQRIELMETEDASETIEAMRHDVNEALVSQHIPAKSYPEHWDTEGLAKEMFRVYGLHLPIVDWAKEEGIADEEILERITNLTGEQWADKLNLYGEEMMRSVSKRVLLQTLDQLWKDHLLSLDHLRAGIGLRAYGQRDPLNEYKQEAFTLFEGMLSHLRETTISRLAHLQIRMEAPPEALEEMRPPTRRLHESRYDPALQGAEQSADIIPMQSRVAPEARDPNDPETWGRVGRNELCPCGSGKKYKHCHGVTV
ncbi:MAG: preprotein translocase subunit SecA [Rickettsiales bacterium]